MSKVRAFVDRNISNNGSTTFAYAYRQLLPEFDADEKDAAAKTGELPAMPVNIREIVETLRRPSHITCAQQELLVAFIDAAFQQPLPQWELDARELESIDEHLGYPAAVRIAARIREANRAK